MKRAMALVVVALASGCDDTSSPISPTMAPAGPSSPTYTLSGIVVESSASGTRPVAGATVGGWINTATSGYGVRGGTSDAAGRFEISRLAEGEVRITVVKQGYVQPCVTRVKVDRDTTVDVEVASVTTPYPMKVQPLLLSGLIWEMAPEGRRPVAGAEVSPTWFDAPILTTVSDANGRYFLCGLENSGPSPVEGIWVRKSGYGDFESRLTLSGANTPLDIELARR